MAKIVVIGGLAESLLNFRGPLLETLVRRGHEVWACAAEENSDVIPALERLGIRYHAIYMSRTGMNPVVDIKTLITILHLLRNVRPDIVLAYTIKPVIYGSIAARLAGVAKIFSMITGLGYTFENGSTAQRVINQGVRFLYRLALRNNTAVFFQNKDDLSMFALDGIVDVRSKAVLINGSGVDLNAFPVAQIPKKEHTFLLIARLIREKGIQEFIEAARILKCRYPSATFQLIGPLVSHPRAFKEGDIIRWREEAVIEYVGEVKDVRPYIARASVYVLPSYYREGIPRTILEALSMGRPVITTDAPGCRETVVNGQNGLLVPVRDVFALAEAMEHFLRRPELIEPMGMRSRAIAEERYDVTKVNTVIMRTMGLVDITPHDAGAVTGRPVPWQVSA